MSMQAHLPLGATPKSAQRLDTSCARTGSVPARSRGFTLIEVMITVAVLAIISAIAYPSYTNHVRKARRATAQAALMDIGAKQQAYLLDRRGYANKLSDLGFAMPQEINGAYTIADPVVDNGASPMTFTITATPVNAQASGGEQALTLNQAGVRTPAKAGYWGQ
jgi:type IV pilus assembly protein PilE